MASLESDPAPLAFDALDALGCESAHPAASMLNLAHRAAERRREGRIGEALSLLDEALAWAELLPATDAASELWCEQAETFADWAEQLDGHAPHARAQRDYLHEQVRCSSLQAASLARRASDPQWEAQLLLRASDVLDRIGNHGDALTLQARALHLLVPMEPASPPESPSGTGTEAPSPAAAPGQREVQDDPQSAPLSA